jgi:hypothetical protein
MIPPLSSVLLTIAPSYVSPDRAQELTEHVDLRHNIEQDRGELAHDQRGIVKFGVLSHTVQEIFRALAPLRQIAAHVYAPRLGAGAEVL